MRTEGKDDNLKTFDMYHFFSRKDVIAIILLLLGLVAFTVYKLVMTPAAV